MIFYNTIGHIEIIEEKDLVHIVKSIWRYFYSSEIIPIFGIILCVLSLFSYSQNYCELCDKKKRIKIIINHLLPTFFANHIYL